MTLQDMLETYYRIDEFMLYYYDPYNSAILKGPQQVIIGKRTPQRVLEGMSDETFALALHNRSKHRAGTLTEDEAVIPCFKKEDSLDDCVRHQHKKFSYNPSTREIETDFVDYYGWDNESTKQYMSIRALVSLHGAEERKERYEKDDRHQQNQPRFNSHAPDHVCSSFDRTRKVDTASSKKWADSFN